jgi:hypothetical protein
MRDEGGRVRGKGGRTNQVDCLFSSLILHPFF